MRARAGAAGVLAASSGGVSPRVPTRGETPRELAGEDACGTLPGPHVGRRQLPSRTRSASSRRRLRIAVGRARLSSARRWGVRTVRRRAGDRRALPSGFSVSVVAKDRAVRIVASGSLASVWNGGEGRGEETLRTGETICMGWATLSPPLSPFVPHGARETDALLVTTVPARTFAAVGRARLSSARRWDVRTVRRRAGDRRALP